MPQESDELSTPMSTLIRASHRELMKGVHTMLPGVIESFDPNTQRAKVNLATAQETVEGDKLSFPPLVNVPVQFFRWGGFSITAPVSPGDECSVVFSERSMDRFLSEGGSDKIPHEGRFFDLSDAFALTGLNSSGNVVPGFDPVNMVIKHDTSKSQMNLTPDGNINMQTAMNVNIDTGAKPSTATLNFTGIDGTVIPLGALVTDTSGAQYSTDAEVIIAGGVGTIESTCTVTGPTESPAGTISIITNPIPGWFTVTNPMDAVVGSIDGTIVKILDTGKISITNASGEVITVISDLLGILAAETVTITAGSSAGTYPITGNLSGAYAALKTIIDTFKV